jgi:hypothetical protein
MKMPKFSFNRKDIEQNLEPEAELQPNPLPPAVSVGQKQPSSVKEFMKRFWWVGIIVLLGAGFAYAWVSGHSGKQNGQDKPIIGDASILAYDSSIPECPADLAGILDHEIIPMEDLDGLMPLGMLSPGGHTIPTDHMYLNHFGQKRISVYAPGDITLISMDDKVTYNAETNAKIHDDYSMEFALCRGLVIALNHFAELDQVVSSAWEAADKRCDTSDKWHFGTDTTTYYQPCQTQLKVPLRSGDLLGYIDILAGGANLNSSIDLGAYNYNGTPHDFANPSRYSEANLHSMCGIDLFTEPLKEAYYSMLGDISFEGGTITLIPRVGEPLCGTDMQDVPGTLAGNWFAGTYSGGGVTRNQYMLALVHSLADTNAGEISLQGPSELGGNQNLKFVPTHSGYQNREFSEVTADGQIYCYQNAKSREAGVDKAGNPIAVAYPKYLIQLVDTTHLNIEQQTGICGTDEIFVSPFTYER